MTDHVRTPAGVARFHAPIGSPIVRHFGRRPGVLRLADYKALRRTPKHKPHDLKTTTQSVNTEKFAQQRATQWHDDIMSSDPDPDASDGMDAKNLEASLWYEYQTPAAYSKINAVLRDNLTIDGVTPAQLRQSAYDLFNDAGYETPTDTVLYRGLKSEPGGIDWSEHLKVGEGYEDLGFVSTTAFPEFGEGWLYLGHDGQLGREVNPTDVVMEIRVPAGTKVLGGSTDFIETMLPPGTRFRVISSAPQLTAPHDPLGTLPDIDPAELLGPITPLSYDVDSRGPLVSTTYTHVVVELGT